MSEQQMQRQPQHPPWVLEEKKVIALQQIAKSTSTVATVASVFLILNILGVFLFMVALNQG